MSVESTGPTVEMPEKLERAPGPGFFESWRWISRWRKDLYRPVGELMEVYGDIARLDIGIECIHMLNQPDWVQECLVTRRRDFHKDKYYFFLKLILGEGLLTSEEDFHFRQRRMIQPAFHKERIHAYGMVMSQYATRAMESWEDGRTVDINAVMMKVALDIVSKTLFNSDVSDASEQVADALETILSYSEFYMGPVGLVLSKLPLPVNRPFFDAIKLLDDILFEMIREHRASGDQGDLLSMLLCAQDEDDGGQMTDQQVRNEAITLFLAGHETTAVALTWTWYLISQHPEVEEKLHAELDAVLAGREPEAGDYFRLDYTHRVFKEAMRLYPPAYLYGRQAIRDTQLGPYRIAKGDMVIVAPCTIQRNPKYYDNPDAFDPDRWLPERCEGLHKYAYLPFGGGQRKCVGEPFAWMEGVLVLATIAQHWRMDLHPDHEVGFDPSVTLRPQGGMPVVLRRR